MKKPTVLSLLNELISLLRTGRMPLTALDGFLQQFRSTVALSPDSLPKDLDHLPENFDLEGFLNEIKKRKVLTALAKARGNLTRASLLLGIKRSHLMRFMHQNELSALD